MKDATEIYGKLVGTFQSFDQSDTFLSISVIVAATLSSANAKKSFQSIQEAMVAFQQSDSSLSSIPYEVMMAAPRSIHCTPAFELGEENPLFQTNEWRFLNF